MRPQAEIKERPLYWVASAKADLMCMPAMVMREIGAALSVAQYGGKHPSAKPWQGEDPGVYEVVSDFSGNTFRAVYAVKFERAIYALHCFQKKSPRGIKTAMPDVNLIRQRLQAARHDYQTRYGKAQR